ncbi:hypothetical protein [Massilia glaciei]|uniref:Uncharacterized protein n=1 Tax=Massilia glaciei TaxID=1524097 RepID=A0A2U2I7L3_9BURK|nr:hypothetical protein [Massilia glaciei]PWF55730.1 hypothetical protein C7C56_000325 [Massilia glaciei]
MLAISIMGVTPGLEVVTFGKLPFPLVDSWITISTSELVVQPSQSAYVVTRRIVDRHLLTWIGYYRSAFAIGGSRDGGYYGAGIWLVDHQVPGEAVVNLLPLLADQVNRLAMSNGRFVRRLDDIHEEIQWPDAEGKRLRQSMTPLVDARGLGSGNLAWGYLDLANRDHAPYLGLFLDWIQSGAPFTTFSRIALSPDAAVTESVRERGSMKLISPYNLLAGDAPQAGALKLAALTEQLAGAELEFEKMLGANTELHQQIQQAQRRETELRAQAGKQEAALNSAETRLKEQQGKHVLELDAARAGLFARLEPLEESIRQLHGQLEASQKARAALAFELDSARRGASKNPAPLYGTGGSMTPQAYESKSDARSIAALNDNLYHAQKCEFELARKLQVLELENRQLRDRYNDGGWLRYWTATQHLRHLPALALGVLVLVLVSLISQRLFKIPVPDDPPLPGISPPIEIQLCGDPETSLSNWKMVFSSQSIVSADEAAAFIVDNACSKRDKICRSQDLVQIRAQLIRAATSGVQTGGVPQIDPGQSTALRLPIGCSAGEFSDKGMVLLPGVDTAPVSAKVIEPAAPKATQQPAPSLSSQLASIQRQRQTQLPLLKQCSANVRTPTLEKACKELRKREETERQMKQSGGAKPPPHPPPPQRVAPDANIWQNGIGPVEPLPGHDSGTPISGHDK